MEAKQDQTAVQRIENDFPSIDAFPSHLRSSMHFSMRSSPDTSFDNYNNSSIPLTATPSYFLVELPVCRCDDNSTETSHETDSVSSSTLECHGNSVSLNSISTQSTATRVSNFCSGFSAFEECMQTVKEVAERLNEFLATENLDEANPRLVHEARSIANNYERMSTKRALEGNIVSPIRSLTALSSILCEKDKKLLNRILFIASKAAREAEYAIHRRKFGSCSPINSKASSSSCPTTSDLSSMQTSRANKIHDAPSCNSDSISSDHHHDENTNPNCSNHGKDNNRKKMAKTNSVCKSIYCSCSKGENERPKTPNDDDIHEVNESFASDLNISTKSTSLDEVMHQSCIHSNNYSVLTPLEVHHDDTLNITPPTLDRKWLHAISRSRDADSPFARMPTLQDFEKLKGISRGAFGSVFLVRKKDTAAIYAMKVMTNRTLCRKNMLTQAISERDSMALSTSPFVVNLYYSFRSSYGVHLVMEYMIGGDLGQLLFNLEVLSEDEANFYLAEIVQALEFLHQHNIIHRDLKPDNILISADGHIKLSDFGLSKILRSNCKRTPTHQTPNHERHGSCDTIKKTLRCDETFVQDNGCRYLDYRSSKPKETALVCKSEGNLQISDKIQASIESCGNEIFAKQKSCTKHVSDRQRKFDMKELSTDVLLKRTPGQQLSISSDLTRVPGCISKRKLLLRMQAQEQSPASISSESFITENTHKDGISSPSPRLDYKRRKRYRELQRGASSPVWISPSSLNPKRWQVLSVISQDKSQCFLESPTDEKRSHLQQVSDVTANDSLNHSQLSQGLESKTPTNHYAILDHVYTPRKGLPDGYALVQEGWINLHVHSDHNEKDGDANGIKFLGDCIIADNPEENSSVVDDSEENVSVKGTPDYVAPELLLGTGHHQAVDIWSLGVIAYELVMGIPPFNDETKEQVFQHILQHDMYPPEDVSPQFEEFIRVCLRQTPEERPSATQLKSHPIFSTIDFPNLRNQVPPFIPKPKNETDTGYFDGRDRGKLSVIPGL